MVSQDLVTRHTPLPLPFRSFVDLPSPPLPLPLPLPQKRKAKGERNALEEHAISIVTRCYTAVQDGLF